jgi:6-phosphogluconate dehydrogenase
MNIGLVGLGRMGESLALQAIGKGHSVVGYDHNPDRARAVAKNGIAPALSLAELAQKLSPPRIILVYVPHGEPTHQTINGLKDVAEAGDLIADGGNSHWNDSIRHHESLKSRGIAFLDVGTSGGVEGALTGACFMVGGEADAFARIEPCFAISLYRKVWSMPALPAQVTT